MATVSGNIIRVSARQVYALISEVVNVHHFTVQQNLAATDQAVLDEVGAKLAQAWTNIQGLVPNNQLPNIIDVYNVSQDYPLGAVAWGSAYAGGSVSGDPLPSQDCALILWNTAVKHVQGKTYLGVFSEASLSGGTFSGATITAMAGYANDMQDPAAIVADCELLLGVWSAAAAEMRPIVSLRLSANPATQRRRRYGRGS